ncbi:hypothetical protein B4R02_26100, partial [Salmonella enterica subsp. diarizonae serovar 42:l,v:1,5,7]|nr:hypothetical protein [Salmonella enterica subsp. diarizonae serovar 42:l,v:1,5,7]
MNKTKLLIVTSIFSAIFLVSIPNAQSSTPSFLDSGILLAKNGNGGNGGNGGKGENGGSGNNSSGGNG